MVFPTGWARKCKITALGSQISGSNVNFPVLITQDNLPAEMLDGGVNSALNGGGDVVATLDAAGLIRLDLDVVAFVTGDVPFVQMYAKFPDLIENINKEIWLWYRKPGQTQPIVSAPFGGNAAWSEAQTALVMESSNPIDRTGNHVFNLIGALTNIAGPFGRANIFSGSARLWNDDPVLRDILLTYNTTVSVVSRNNNFASSEAVLSWEGVDDFNLYPMSNSAPLVDGVRVFWRNVVNNNTFEASNISPADTWAWTSVTTRASNNHEIYQNGVSVASDTNSGTAGPFTAFYIGGFGATSQSWNGDIAQVIVWKTARSSDWTNTTHSNQSNPSAFASAGAPEAVGGGAPNVTERLCGVETLSTTTVSHSLPVTTGRLLSHIAACLVENLLEISQADLLAVSHQLKREFQNELITEILAGISIEKTIPVANASQISFDHILPVEWSGAVVVEFTHAVPVEWTALVAHEHALPIDHMAQVADGRSVPAETLRDNVTDHNLPVAWSGAVVVEFTHDIPVEWTTEFADMKSVPVENMALIVSEAALPLEQISQFVQDKNIPAEFIMNVITNHILPVEWQGVDGFISGISNVFKNFGGSGVKFAGRGRSTIFPKRKG
ncbi:MAG: hypothetical protein JKY45_10440 [Emcibacter sp.]|nr:hypothetical protein [Emcibacter sp.]